MDQVSDEYSLLKATGDFYDSLPSSLVSPAQLKLLKQAADFFPPLIRFGLECRLNNQEQVDLQLCIRRDEDDLPAISGWFQNKLRGDQEFERITDFLSRWADKSSAYHENISEVFLELDVLPSGIKAPLLFLELQRGLTDAGMKAFCLPMLAETLGGTASFFKCFETILKACPAPAFIAYLGIQFSRDVKVLRINIKRLPVTAVAPFLERIGYAWTGPALNHWIAATFNYADQVTLCIDVAENVLPGIGLECFWKGQPRKEAYWQFFIDNLNTHQPFHKEKIAEVLNWNKEIFPGHINNWPEHLWIASLSRPENEFTFLKKWISHLKLSYHPEKDITLKAYLGYEHLWKMKETSALRNGKKERATIKVIIDIEQAISRGIDYLLGSQQQSGWWKDFYLSPGSSDEWITAYVAFHLARMQCPKTMESLESAWNILKTRYRKNEGWGYNALTPADADSTIWTWLFATVAKFTDEFPEPGFDLMKTYLAEDGGIITYSLNGPIGKNAREMGRQQFNGWQIPHNCVTAAYALTGAQNAIDFLIAHQHVNGYWYSYWWAGPEYATALSVEALFMKDADKYKEAIAAAVKWALGEAKKELADAAPNDFKIGLLLKTILCSPLNKDQRMLAQSMVDYLLDTQQPLGYWNPSAEMRFPVPSDTAHEKGEKVLVVKDDRKNFATVTILDTLFRFNQLKFLP